MNGASQRLVAAFALPEQQRSFFVGLFWRAGLGLVALAALLFALAPWIAGGSALAVVAVACAVGGALASVLVARLLHGRRFWLRYAIAALASLCGGGVAIYLVELPSALFVATATVALALLGLIFYRAEDVARTRALDERWRAAFELVAGLVIAIPRWMVATVRRDD